MQSENLKILKKETINTVAEGLLIKINKEIFFDYSFKEKWLPAFENILKKLRENSPEFLQYALEERTHHSAEKFLDLIFSLCKETQITYRIIFANEFKINTTKKEFSEAWKEFAKEIHNDPKLHFYLGATLSKDEIDDLNANMIIQENLEALQEYTIQNKELKIKQDETKNKLCQLIQFLADIASERAYIYNLIIDEYTQLLK